MQTSRYRIDPRTCPSCLRPQSRLALDRAPPSARSAFIRAKKTEDWYAKRLRAVAGHISELLRGLGIADLFGARRLQRDLQNYSEALKPWAEAVGGRMVAEVAQRDERSWQRVAGEMGRALKQEIATAPTGRVMREQLAEQVKLITSLPVEAGQRVHDLAVKGISAGTRADAVADEIMRTGEVTKARATLIARTETSRTATLLTQSRAQHIGSTHFIWRTAGDSDVRDTHRALNGKTFRWDDPPECDPGHHALPGCIWNCRCFAEPVIPD